VRATRLRGAIDGRRAAGLELEAVDLAPKSAPEALTRQMVSDLAADMAEIRNRVNGMFWLVVAAVVVDVVMRVAGIG
jgi:hypothetical protein